MTLRPASAGLFFSKADRYHPLMATARTMKTSKSLKTPAGPEPQPVPPEGLAEPQAGSLSRVFKPEQLEAGGREQSKRLAAKERRSIVTIRPMFLARPDAAAFLAISASMLDTLAARGDLPKPRKLSAGRTAWLVEDLENWGRERPESDLLPPVNCGYGQRGKPGA